MKYELHPACAMWPQMPDDEIDAMAADIKARGLEHPIVLIGDEILDGRNRAMACEKIGIEPATEAYVGDDPIAYTISVNLNRRHLTVGQRALIAAEIETMKNGGDRGANQYGEWQSPNSKTATLDKVTNALGIGLTSVYEARKIKDNGDAETIEGVKSGKLSLHKASKRVRGAAKPPREQSPQSAKRAQLKQWHREQNEAAIAAALRRAAKPKVTDEEFERPPPELLDQQYPGRPPGVTYANVHREEHGPIWHNVSKRRQQTLVLKLKELAADLEKAVEDFAILDPEQKASVRKRWRIAAERIRPSINLGEMVDDEDLMESASNEHR
jgi:hypothetical protein